MNKPNKIRLALLEGKFPAIAHRDIKKIFGKDVATITRSMLESAWNMYLLQGIDKNGESKGSISTKNFAKNIGDILITNKILKSLSKLGWITVYSKNNWSDLRLNHSKLLEFCTADELVKIRAFNKFNKYKLTNEPATMDNLVRINGRTIKATESKRTGFMKAGNTEFKFDTKAMWENLDVIKQEVNKGMAKVRLEHSDMLMDEAMYDEVATAILDHIIYNPHNIYRPGQPTSDSRLRNIAGYTDKIFNVVASKVARACLVIPAHLRNEATNRGVNNYYLMIAEVCGTFVSGTKQDKIDMGREHYLNRTLHNLDYSKEDDRGEAHENIWLSRIYDELDGYFKNQKLSFVQRVLKKRVVENTATIKDYKEKATEWHLARLPKLIKENRKIYQELESVPSSGYRWSVPVEVDMSASVLGYVGALTNHAPFMRRCNMIGDELGQAWEFEGLTKKQAKVIMQKIYGSEQSARDIWKDGKIAFTSEQVKIFNRLLETGELAVGDKFSKFIINNCTPREKMRVHLGDEFINIECNKFFLKGETAERFDLYDTETDTIPTITHHSVVKIPNLEAFRRFMVTCLIHNRDGWNEDRTCELVYDKYQWILDVHDASIVCPEAGDYTREVYAEGANIINRDRNKILTNFFRSIGISNSAMLAYKEDVQAYVTPLGEPLKCNEMILK